jgi:hypothetical protein
MSALKVFLLKLPVNAEHNIQVSLPNPRNLLLSLNLITINPAS